MTTIVPRTDVDVRYGEPGATARPWEEAEDALRRAQISWISTVRPDGRPHVTPLLTVWRDGALHFCTGAHERKARNLEANPAVVLTVSSPAGGGLDVVVEGVAERVADDDRLRGLAAAWEADHGPEWRFEVADGAFVDPYGGALVFRVAPVTVFGFARSPAGQTRWRFGPA
ncbi:pyridoxamine 5'-phosphate oxidase family protein [Geodermatophilus sp. SYSU D01106]